MNGKVICDTGPVTALSMIDRIDILRPRALQILY